MEIELDTKPDKWLKAFINNKTLIWMRVMTHETFSLVIKPTTAWFILSIVFQFKWSLHQLDVKNAFLQCILREEVCDTTHWFCGFYSPISSFFDCTSLYGFKQATLYLLHLGIHALSANTSLMIYHHYSSIFLLLLYVDDIILTSNDSSYLNSLIQNLGFIFELKDLSPLHYFPGLQTHYTLVCLVINQNMPITFLFNITCLILNLAINPAFPPLDLTNQMALPYLILHPIIFSLELFNN